MPRDVCTVMRRWDADKNQQVKGGRCVKGKLEDLGERNLEEGGYGKNSKLKTTRDC